MANVRVLLSFTRVSDLRLADFSNGVLQGMAGNASFKTPPVPMDQLEKAAKDFADAITARREGGRQATRNRDAKRGALVVLLRTLANYVQVACKDDLDVLATSGFSPVVQNNSRSELERPQVISIAPGRSTFLVVRIQPVAHAKSYEARFRNGTEAWSPGGVFTDSRRISVGNLKPGTVYTIQVRAIGGITGASDWSADATLMAT